MKMRASDRYHTTNADDDRVGSEEEELRSISPHDNVFDHLKWAIVSTIISIFLSALTTILPLVTTNSRTASSLKEIFFGGKIPSLMRGGFLFLLGGLLLLAVGTVVAASVIRFKNRNVIRLQERLAQIYVSALKKSALNPALQPQRDDYADSGARI